MTDQQRPPNALNPEGFSFDPNTPQEDYRLYEHLGPDLSAYLVYDRFNRADGPLGNAETGQTWVTIYPGDPPVEILAGQAVPHGGEVVVQIDTDDYDARLTVAEIADDPLLLFRAHPSGSPYGYFRVLANSDAPQGWSYVIGMPIVNLDTSVLTVTISGDTPVALAPGDTLRLHVLGTTVAAYINNTLVVSGDLALQMTEGQTIYTSGLVGFADQHSGPNSYSLFAVTAP